VTPSQETHVLHEASGPPDADVWRMWCGAECFAFDDGTLCPQLDFYGEAAASKATCQGCRRSFTDGVLGEEQESGPRRLAVA
jgi:hypothetical protein